MPTARCRPGPEPRPASGLPDVDAAGGPGLAPPPSVTAEQGLVQHQRGDLTDPVRVVVDQSGALGDHRVVDGMPVTAQLGGDLVDGTATPAHSVGDPPSCPIRQRQP